MPTPKAAAAVQAPAKAPVKVEKSVRLLQDLVPEIRRMRDEGHTVPLICEELDMTYDVVNQIMQQSYKMTMNTVEVFERQEKRRLGLDD